MSLYHQNIESWRSTIPTTINFVLPGRRTLTENLPPETISFPISLAHRSKHLSNVLLQQDWDTCSTRHIKLDNTDPAGFKLYTEWLQTGHIAFDYHHAPRSLEGALLRDCVDLVFAHILGSSFKEPNFQDYVIDTMERLLDASQEPDVQVLGSVLLEKGVADVLRQFVIDRMFAVEKKMLQMIKGSVNEVVGGKWGDVGCEYHLHDEGRCYKSSTREKEDAEAIKVADPTRSTSEERRPSMDTSEYHGRQRRYSALSTSSYLNSGYDSILSDTLDERSWSSKELYQDGQTVEQQQHSVYLNPDEPLPGMPSLKHRSPPTTSSPLSERSSIVDFPPASYMDSAANHALIEAISTQELVHECLKRFAPSVGPEPYPIDLETRRDLDPVPELVLECVERFKNTTVEDGSFSSVSISPTRSSFSEEGHTYNPTSASRQRQDRRVRFEKSFEDMPMPAHEQKHQPLDIPDRPYEQGHDHFKSPSSPPKRADPVICPPTSQVPNDLPKLRQPQSIKHGVVIKRKPAPARGIDWLAQYDRVNPLMSTPVVVAKRSKRSKFKEMFRNESMLGKVSR